jgi:hypothetical protein
MTTPYVPDTGVDACDYIQEQHGWRPGRLKAFVEQELVPRRAAWVAAGKPVMEWRWMFGSSFDAKLKDPAERLLDKWGKILGFGAGFARVEAKEA